MNLSAAYANQTLAYAAEQFTDPTEAETRAIDAAHAAGRCPYCHHADPCPCTTVQAKTERRAAA